MNNIKIGIPKALLYYKYSILWTAFFEKLGCTVVLSPDTNKDILEMGIRKSLDESCLAMKIYMGHVEYLMDKCDYVLVPRLKCLKKKEQLCTNFQALYDLTQNVFDKQILTYNVDLEKGFTEEKGFIAMGKRLGFSKVQALNAYNLAKLSEEKQKKKKAKERSVILKTTKKLKILLAGHPYNLYDDFIGKQIEAVLKNSDIEVFYSDVYQALDIDKEIEPISKSNYWTFNKEMIASIAYHEPLVDGIILITSFPCGPDSLSNEMILRNVHIPIINLIIDESDSNTGLITRIESFIDIIEERKKHE